MANALDILQSCTKPLKWYVEKHDHKHYTIKQLYMMWSNITQYLIQKCSAQGRTLGRLWIHKKHPIPCPPMLAMGCLLWVVWRKLTLYQWHCIVSNFVFSIPCLLVAYPGWVTYFSRPIYAGDQLFNYSFDKFIFVSFYESMKAVIWEMHHK